MKSKISITLSSELLADIDRLAGRRYSRSEVIDRLLQHSLLKRKRERIDAEEVEKINRNAEYWKREMRDVLKYQTMPDFDEEE
jgi:metal-responsive CopG/Arc/MetJ family transcriptional regulator